MHYLHQQAFLCLLGLLRLFLLLRIRPGQMAFQTFGYSISRCIPFLQDDQHHQIDSGYSKQPGNIYR